MTERAPQPGNAGPLSGFRIIDLTTNVLGPVATQILGDMGADVVKIEAPEGDHTRHVGPSRSEAMGVFFLNINRNKRSVVLDLKKPKAREALSRLIETADVFVHSMRPDAAKRLGIDYQTLTRLNPKLVYASASGYRPASSRRNWPAFDDVIQGLSGIASMNGRNIGEPRYFPTVIADKHCGYVLSSAISMALLWRERTGEGQEVHVPMMESMVTFNMLEHLWGGVLDEPELGLGYSRMFTPHRRPYRTIDGYICLLANTDEQWHRLFNVIGCPEMGKDPRYAKVNARSRNIDAVYAILADRMAQETTDEWRRRLDEADIPNGPVQDFDDLLNDPYLEETHFFQKVSHPTEGRYMTTAIPVEFSKSGGTIRRLAPRLGEHTQEVLRGCGLSDTEIDALTQTRSAEKVLVNT
ncbi:CaiB/BaiF CoA transferase family protein [Rhizobium sp. C4]|uniref:CaiB/BaiF CoA transferase family protein n=1 Tax=Rhizobium sp. C4 TaxID=1349800 RepID=UPI001E599D72|nr:CoA transferase [Rhizobium sp. C4]MCD2172257.1 CoA transferase [Rhizobium sp. C4]